MQFQNILITGGAGFLGSRLAIHLRNCYPNINITALDNLKRRGSEYNFQDLKRSGVVFIHGDVRNPEDLQAINPYDLIIDCCAEPSVLAGVADHPLGVINSNLLGTINTLELARQFGSRFLFISTSRVYDYKILNSLQLHSNKTRFTLDAGQQISGISSAGLSEDFPLGKYRSLYGATKLCSELLLLEYMAAYNLKGIINRFGVIAGPHQMGKSDQGIAVFWMARHVFQDTPLTYIGYGGSGLQVRDFLHIDDACVAIETQLKHFDKLNDNIFNIGGGAEISASLQELTALCQKISGNSVTIHKSQPDRPNDIPWYISDTELFRQATDWKPTKDMSSILVDIHEWLQNNKGILREILQ